MNLLAFALILCLFCCLLLSQLKIKRQSKNTLTIGVCGIILTFFHIYKDVTTLPDLDIYVNFFQNLRYLNTNSSSTIIFGLNRFEPGWTLMNYLIGVFCHSSIILIITTSIIILSGYLYFIKKYSPTIWLSIIVFFAWGYCQSLYVLRQYCAISICLYTIPFIWKRQLFKYLFTVIFAISFHYSAIVFLPIYWIFNIKLNSKILIKLLVASVIGSLAVSYAIKKILGSQSYYTETYLNSTEIGGATYTGLIINLTILVLCLIAFNISKLSGYKKLLFLMLCTATVISFIGVGIPGIVRLNLYYTTCYIVLIPIALSKLNQKMRIPAYFLISFCFCLLFLIALKGDSLSHYSLII